MRTVFVFIYKERGQNHYLLTHDPYIPHPKRFLRCLSTYEEPRERQGKLMIMCYQHGWLFWRVGSS